MLCEAHNLHLPVSIGSLCVIMVEDDDFDAFINYDEGDGTN
jgi:hypothetical protein